VREKDSLENQMKEEEKRFRGCRKESDCGAAFSLNFFRFAMGQIPTETMFFCRLSFCLKHHNAIIYPLFYLKTALHFSEV